ncbi:hypothetical protein [Hymenobacter arizonensis]|uniref:Outer membrane protein beta-barrel domain-containing protein n=1 Tax=Hymenobacter arizonensis TaxID=1227077 RepID=A0A1I5Y771_HYMAR|nr:hypothetical protein [Hymenobacter arizonensis]SFQ39767.1 hypothetical protein SAMN04515668_2260 [Hymenobacter arizonensis]
MPVIRDKGQGEAALATGLNGTELKAGYQLTDKLIVHTSLLQYGLLRDVNKFRSADLGVGYYYNSPNGFWRLGMHTGAAYGSGKSAGGGGFDSTGPIVSSDYNLRYSYAYVQPTVLLLDNRKTWGIGVRFGRAYYHRFTLLRTDSTGGPTQNINYAGRQAAFVQVSAQHSYQLSRWLMLSGSFGAQGYLNKPTAIGDMPPFVGQVGIHFLLSNRSAL